MVSLPKPSDWVPASKCGHWGTTEAVSVKTDQGCPMPDTADQTVLPRDTDGHISHHQAWENIFKKGHKMPQSIEGREKTERG